MGGLRNDLNELRKIIPDPYGQADDLVPAVTSYVDERGLTQYIYTLKTPGGSGQAKIQFEYNGTNLGTIGTVTAFNVASSWATFTRAADTVTLTIATPVQSLNALTGALSLTSTGGTVTITPAGSTINLEAGGSYVAPQARLATAAALPTNTYANGASGVGATLTAVATGTLTVDGVAVAIGNNVLVKNESTASHNGLYTCTVAGALGVAYILTRTTGMDQPAEFLNALVPVGPEGSTNADTLWQSVPVPPVTVGTTAIPFVKDSGSGLTSPLTTKGDLWGFSSVDARLPVGANLTLPVADSSQTLGLRYAPLVGSLDLSIGRERGAILTAGAIRTFLVPAGFTGASAWEMACDPLATCSIDIWYLTFGSSRPTVANTIVGGNYPAIAAGVNSTGTTSGWGTTAFTAGAYITFQVRSNDFATQILFKLTATRTL